jgi:hypothetical protein
MKMSADYAVISMINRGNISVITGCYIAACRFLVDQGRMSNRRADVMSYFHGAIRLTNILKVW